MHYPVSRTVRLLSASSLLVRYFNPLSQTSSSRRSVECCLFSIAHFFSSWYSPPVFCTLLTLISGWFPYLYPSSWVHSDVSSLFLPSYVKLWRPLLFFFGSVLPVASPSSPIFVNALYPSLTLTDISFFPYRFSKAMSSHCLRFLWRSTRVYFFPYRSVFFLLNS